MAVYKSDGSGGAIGGGSSTVFPIPLWQTSVKDKITTQSGTGRAIPDLAWNAAKNGGVLVYMDGSWNEYGGTSAASPQIAGFFALVNQYLNENGMDFIGHLNPLLYQINDSAAFNDILPIKLCTVLAGEQVTNRQFQYDDNGELMYSDVPGYPVTSGWDMTTGFGSPQGKAFLNALVKVMENNE
ncbi:hypothetical protein [uncultured Shewanella sp.]|uniref:hypothetical protein n=1 Tax=uncultured Shewanella sp. TaxID=173975 RepID=UPI002633C9D2|nr:hypothetical protein [uncultured Shewanella sp.]